MIKEILIVFTFLTRIPFKISFTYGAEDMGRTSRYFPLVGLVIGFFALFLLFIKIIFPFSNILYFLNIYPKYHFSIKSFEFTIMNTAIMHDHTKLYPVVGGFLRNLNIMRMTFHQTCRCNAYKSGMLF
jgi:hypothetical protein